MSTKDLIWIGGNTLGITDLYKEMRENDVPCNVLSCQREAIDIHHIDGDHSNHAPINLAPACKICHNQAHGITAKITDLKLVVRELQAIQANRLSAEYRLDAYSVIEEQLQYTEQSYNDLIAIEDKLKGYIKALLKAEPFYNAWLKHVKGMGPILSARVIAEMESPDRFRTPRQLWAYSGLHVVDGKAPRRKKGEKANWNNTLRTTFYMCARQFIKNKDCLGRKLYDEYKQYYVERDNKEHPKWKYDALACRRVMKDFSRCLLIAWRESRGLWTSEPHPNTRVLPHHWLWNGIEEPLLTNAERQLINFISKYRNEHDIEPSRQKCAEVLEFDYSWICSLFRTLGGRGLLADDMMERFW